jgi:hypothetical protein
MVGKCPFQESVAEVLEQFTGTVTVRPLSKIRPGSYRKQSGHVV